MSDSFSSSSLGVLLRLLNQQFSLEVGQVLREQGFGDLRLTHANVFTFIAPEGTQVSALAQRAHIRKQSMAQAVEELERLGYVRRESDPNDQRGKLVFLTERGQQVRPAAMAAGEQVEQRWASLTSGQDLDQLKGLLQEVFAQVQVNQ